jgi:DNA-binding HxlR family transcriptional regulator
MQASATQARDSAVADVDPCVAAVASVDAALVRVFGFLGKRWNGLIIATLTAGEMSFSNLARSVVGISDSVLSERLNGLGAAGIVLRSVEHGPPISVTYQLSPAGLALAPALTELTRWAQQNMSEPEPTAQACDAAFVASEPGE